MRQTRTPFAIVDGERGVRRRSPRPVAVTWRNQTRIFPSYQAMRDEVLADCQPLLDSWVAAAEARGRAQGRRELVCAVALAFCAPPVAVLLILALAR